MEMDQDLAISPINDKGVIGSIGAERTGGDKTPSPIRAKRYGTPSHIVKRLTRCMEINLYFSYRPDIDLI